MNVLKELQHALDSFLLEPLIVIIDAYLNQKIFLVGNICNVNMNPRFISLDVQGYDTLQDILDYVTLLTGIPLRKQIGGNGDKRYVNMTLRVEQTHYTNNDTLRLWH
jgi:hypothetical protein